MKLLTIILCFAGGACNDSEGNSYLPSKKENTEVEETQNEQPYQENYASKEHLNKEQENEPPVKENYTLYIINKGEHSSNLGGIKAVNNDSIVFEVIFDSSAIYTTQSRENQADINKLFGFSDCSSFHQQNSARVGWRYHKNGLELFAYCYANGERSFLSIGSIEIGKPYVCTIVAKEGNYVFLLNHQNPISLKRGCNNGGFRFKLYPYFGGNETAPHTISIQIKEIT